jgi:AraC-like DNA-binding protein
MSGLISAASRFFEQLTASDAPTWPSHVFIGGDAVDPPPNSFQVPFPRLELVLDGVYSNTLCNARGERYTADLTAGSCLFLPSNSWNQPEWDGDVTVMSLLFGNLHLGLSYVTWNQASGSFRDVEKRSSFLPGGTPVYAMVDALTAFQLERQGGSSFVRLQVRALVEYAMELIAHPPTEDVSRPNLLYQDVCSYILENCHKPAMTRDHLAQRFDVTPTYLSRVFRDQGNTGLSEYITETRIERAKFMLKRYDFRLDEISQRCGFRDVNYFCRSFKRQVGRTPTEYRTGD